MRFLLDGLPDLVRLGDVCISSPSVPLVVEVQPQVILKEALLAIFIYQQSASLHLSKQH